MKLIKCHSASILSLTNISDKAYKIKDLDGSTNIIPKSQVFDKDLGEQNAYWISAWILKQKGIRYSESKVAWFDKDTEKMLPTYHIEKHTPDKRNPVSNNIVHGLSK
jgi:hypothetical protein